MRWGFYCCLFYWVEDRVEDSDEMLVIFLKD